MTDTGWGLLASLGVILLTALILWTNRHDDSDPNG